METKISAHSMTKRPTGVWILTIYDGIFAGILPLFVVISALLSDSGRQFISTSSLISSLVIGLGVVISAIGAWKGNNKSRISLMIFVSVHYGLVGINNAVGLANGADYANLGRVFRGILYPAVNIWYFTRSTTLDFYRDNFLTQFPTTNTTD